MGMGGGGSSGGVQQTTTTSEPWWGIQPYMLQGLQRGSELSQRPYQAYPGQQIAPLTPAHQQGLSMIQQRATAGSPMMQAAQGDITKTLGGGYLSPESNPYLQQTYEKAARGLTDQYSLATMPQLSKAFGGMQAFGADSGYQQASSQAGKNLATGLGDVATGIYGQNYQAERDRMQRAGALAPQLAGMDYQDATQMLGVGDIQRQNQQDVLNMQYQNWLKEQQHPYSQLDVLLNSIRGASGGGGTTTQTAPNPYNPSQAMSMIGGGLAGAGIGGMFDKSYMPYGAAAGAMLPWILGR